ncbi:uncharacterized protein M437DRAFT_40022 [Aureobasidium melanogenum CBS 110374]|uniref:BAR-domain-containing protein n=1 Tax=Aureobasidium melanogenum (strain CBS 110374) TaxID=1043003 RepID=A0A074W0A1_AURM1|nr:uncharacterized protein M437DRAFT_40022 [Aureobasidium melanogenum CBS 110374]KEQ66500.1 hypothetical protein M437DRAFT_40022 [Aureobasidium melanogenum CBS 110374]
MQNVQRKFGKLMKRSADRSDVGGILSEFNTADQALGSFIDATKSWRDGLDETLKTQLYVAETLHLLYKPIEVEDDPNNPTQQKAAPTPRKYLEKAGDLQTIYAHLQKDLSTEVNSIEPRLLRPAMDAKDSLKMLKRSIKRREDLKLDYERYNSRVDSARRKETRSAREENALMKHEADLARTSADYQAADEQLKKVLPPILDGLSNLLPHLLAIQIMIQYQLVGQMYTQLHEYCQTHGLPSPAPALEQVISTFETEFTPLREGIERNIKTISAGKAIHQPMSLPDKQQGTVTGLGLRNHFARRTSSSGSLPKPSVVGGQSRTGAVDIDDEPAPVKPPRPGPSSTPSTSSTPFLTPSSVSHQNQGSDYFSRESKASTSSGTFSVSGKKKPPPPPPKKRAQSFQGEFVTAMYDFAGQGSGDLSFREGDRIKVVKKTGSTDDWWEGELNGELGSFPANYVKLD